MGCDIHLHLEYCVYGTPTDGSPKYWSYMGELHPGRNYDVFAGMAGVRGHFDYTVEPKGYPEDISWWTASEIFKVVVADEDVEWDHHVGKTQADQYVNLRWSVPVKVGQELTKYITNPTYHTPSWLSTEEYGSVIRRVGKENAGVGFVGILAMMESMANAGVECRLVFAFDN